MSKVIRPLSAEARSTLEWRTARIAKTEVFDEATMRRGRRVAPCEWTKSSMNAVDPRFPLGTPLNRPARSPLRPIPGRTHWFVDARGVERYVEPARPTPLRDPVSPEPRGLGAKGHASEP